MSASASFITYYHICYWMNGWMNWESLNHRNHDYCHLNFTFKHEWTEFFSWLLIIILLYLYELYELSLFCCMTHMIMIIIKRRSKWIRKIKLNTLNTPFVSLDQPLDMNRHNNNIQTVIILILMLCHVNIAFFLMYDASRCVMCMKIMNKKHELRDTIFCYKCLMMMMIFL